MNIKGLYEYLEWSECSERFVWGVSQGLCEILADLNVYKENELVVRDM